MLNVWHGMGRLVKDPELKTLQSGVPVCNFTLAVDRDFKNGDEKVTDFVDCTAWRGTAEFISKYFSKGRMMVVSGPFQSQKWEDKEGNKRVSWGVQVQNAYFADSKKDGDGGSSGSSYSADNGGYGGAPNVSAGDFVELPDDGDLPF